MITITTETDTMDTPTETPEQLARRIRILAAAGRSYGLLSGAPLVRFYNEKTGATIVTRDAHVYRALPDWIERPFDFQSPVPRRP